MAKKRTFAKSVTKEMMYNYQYKDNMSIVEIADLYDCTPSAVWQYGKRIGHKFRNNELKKGKNCSPDTQFKKDSTPWNKGRKGYKNKNYPKVMPRGEGSPNWKGGGRDRDTNEYKKWRTDVFQRDDYICQHCLVKGGNLNAHHIVYWNSAEKLRFEVTNGITLCKDCHKNYHNKNGWRKNNAGVLNIA